MAIYAFAQHGLLGSAARTCALTLVDILGTLASVHREPASSWARGSGRIARFVRRVFGAPLGGCSLLASPARDARGSRIECWSSHGLSHDRSSGRQVSDPRGAHMRFGGRTGMSRQHSSRLDRAHSVRPSIPNSLPAHHGRYSRKGDLALTFWATHPFQAAPPDRLAFERVDSGSRTAPSRSASFGSRRMSIAYPHRPPYNKE